MSEDLDEEYYPTIDVEPFCQFIEETGKCDKLEIGTSVFYVIKGSGTIHRRTITIRTNGLGTVDFNLATTVAYRLKFLDQLTAWYEDVRQWKDGAYIKAS